MEDIMEEADEQDRIANQIIELLKEQSLSDVKVLFERAIRIIENRCIL